MSLPGRMITVFLRSSLCMYIYEIYTVQPTFQTGAKKELATSRAHKQIKLKTCLRARRSSHQSIISSSLLFFILMSQLFPTREQMSEQFSKHQPCNLLFLDVPQSVSTHEGSYYESTSPFCTQASVYQSSFAFIFALV